MAEPAVRLDQVWKKFRGGERHDSLRDLVPAVARMLVGKSRTHEGQLSQDDFWALRDISFTVECGEAVGIICPNGAGKSTTFKLLTRILKPTRGQCTVRGRVGALIEVAAGFHPDLTGRENIFLQGAVMHMKRREIARKFDDIVDFAGLHAFIDTPVKRYSSGMNARLGFAIAAHLEPQVLLIDEVLSVGDMAFQQRCVERMREFKNQGVTILFVSHNLEAVAGLCDTAIYLDGEIRAHGPTSGVIEQYVRAANRGRRESGEIEIVGAEMTDRAGNRFDTVKPGTPLRLRISAVAHADMTDLVLGFLAYRSADRLPVYDGNFRLDEFGATSVRAGEMLTFDFNFRAHLTRGQYHFGCHIFHDPTQRYVAQLCPAAMVTVNEKRTWAGVADLEVEPAVVNESRARRQCALPVAVDCAPLEAAAPR